MNNNHFYKRLFPLGTAQTLGVFNDNAFKSVVIFIALGKELYDDLSGKGNIEAADVVFTVAPVVIMNIAKYI